MESPIYYLRGGSFLLSDFLKETNCRLQSVSSADGQQLVLRGNLMYANDLMPTEGTKEFGCALH